MRDIGKRLKRMVRQESDSRGRSSESISRRVLANVGHELKENPPAVLEKTRRKKGKAAAGRQRIAILLNKARRRGARIPRR